MQKRSLLILTTILALAAAGCQLMPINYAEFQEGQWEAKALIKDKQQSKSYVVHVDAQARRNKQLRLDVTAALGTPVASLVVNDDRVEYLLFQQKQFFKGRANERSLAPVLALPMDPRLLYKVLFDEPFQEKIWSCSNDKNGVVEKCLNKKEDLSISWRDRKGRRKTIFIQHPKAEIQLNVISFKPTADHVFELKVPPNFKKVNL